MAPDERGQRESDWSREALCSVVDPTNRFDVSRRSILATTGAGIIGGLLSTTGTAGAQESDALNVKTRPTIWTEEDRENARRNVERYDWAEEEKDDAVSRVESRLADWRGRFGSDADDPDLESLWRAVTSQKIPRGGGFGPQRFISENAGNDGRMWKTDTGVDNPEGEGTITVPTNDFEAYRQSGLDDRGMFDPDLADDDLLVNEEHPELGEGWGVDDGYGFVDEENVLGVDDENYTRWNFVAHYNHWAVWHHGGGIPRVLQELTDAYLLTGEQKYARAGVVMLDRIADVYPEMDLTEYQMYPPGEWTDGFWNSHGGMMTGKAVGAFWESNVMRPIIRAYDAFFPAMEGDDELVDFLEAKTEEFAGLDGKDSIEKIRKNIEDGILREILPAMKNLNMDSGGNSALVQAARVLDEPDGYTEEAIEWVFQPGEQVFDGDTWDAEPENWYATGGNILAPMVDVWDRDGYNNRAGPNYNTIKISGTREVADYLQGYDGFEGADLYEHPKLLQALDVNVPLLLIDEFTPQIGNQHGPTTSEWVSTSIQEGYHVTGEPLFAQVWHFDEGYTTDDIQGSIFDEDPDGLSDEIQEVIDAEGPLDLPSRNLPGYGFAALKDGENHDIGTPEWTYDTSELFVEASTEVDDSFPEAIQLQAYEEGEWWTFEFEVDADGEYDLELEALFVDTYGMYEMSINGEYVDTIDFMADGSGEDTLAYTRELPAGTNELRFECVGKNDASDDYLMALYNLSVAEELDDTGLGNEKRAFWMYYGRNGSDRGGHTHNHADALNVGVAAHKLELSPDLGYPEVTGSWPKRVNWTENTISHNTVTVDESKQDSHWVGHPRHFDGEDDRVNLIDVESPLAYDQCEEYRRTTALITVDERHSYAVDFFRVAGGDEHVFSFHGQVGEATADGVDLVPQEEGTYAGEDIPKPDYGEDTEYNQEVGGGFNYLTDVERDEDPDSTVTVDWDIEDYWDHRSDDAEGVHLRLTSFSDFDEVALADGHPPDRDGNPDSLRYALLKRQGSDLESDFVSTIEHYEGERVVESVEPVEVTGGEAHALKVDLTSGRTDYVVRAFEGLEEPVTVDDAVEFEGFFGVLSLEDGEPEYAYVHDGTLLGLVGEEPLVDETAGHATGFVEDFTREMSLENEVTVRVTDDRDLLDRHTSFVYIDNDNSNPWRGQPDPKEPIGGNDQRGRGNGVYEIEEIVEGRGNLVTVDVGRQTFIRQFSDPDELEDGGYEYMISEDDDLRIPLSASWSAE